MARAVVLPLMVALGVVVALLVLVVLLGQPWTGARVAAEQGVPRFAVIAHRGASSYAPEETLPAYRIAASQGADYLELDLQRSADGVLFALHDDAVARTTNAATVFPGREGQSAAGFSWAELSQLDAGSWFNAAHPERAQQAWVGLHLARLDDILSVAEQGGPGRDGHGPGVYVETKEPQLFPGIEADLVATLRARGWLEPRPGQPAPLIFQSFSPESLEKLRALAPEVPRVLLVGSDMLADKPFSAWIEVARDLGASLGPVGTSVYPWRVGAAHRAGCLVHPYTVDKGWQMALARLLGTDGVFTNEAGLLLSQLGRPPSEDWRVFLTSP